MIHALVIFLAVILSVLVCATALAGPTDEGIAHRVDRALSTQFHSPVEAKCRMLAAGGSECVVQISRQGTQR